MKKNVKKKPVKKKPAKKNITTKELDSLTSQIIASLTKENYIMKLSNVNLTKFIMKKMNLAHDQLITELQTFVDDNQPHTNTDVICTGCGKNWIATHPSSCTELECPECHKMVNIECKRKGQFEFNRKECFNCPEEDCKHRTEPENN